MFLKMEISQRKIFCKLTTLLHPGDIGVPMVVSRKLISKSIVIRRKEKGISAGFESERAAVWVLNSGKISSRYEMTKGIFRFSTP